jgi:hypothetical protein
MLVKNIVLCILLLSTLIFSVRTLYVIVKIGKFSPSKILMMIWAYASITLGFAVIYMYLPISNFTIDTDISYFNVLDEVVYWFYYSLLILVNTDVAGITPVSTLSKIIVIFEILVKILFGFLLINTFVARKEKMEN